MAASLEIFPLGRAAVAARAWAHRGRHLVTAIVKGSFGLRPDAAMVLTDPTPIVDDDRAPRHAPIGSLLHASDLALVVPMPEVLVVGSAHAPAGQRVQRMRVSLELVRDGATLFAKALQIVGSRRGLPKAPPPEPALFDSMPLVYERAYGGLGHRENPVGTGLEADTEGLVQWPNILRSSADENVLEGKGVPPGLGPIPAIWPLRKDKRGSLSHRELYGRADVVLPDDFDEKYFQAAPANQQVPEIKMGDVVVLSGMHPLHTKLRVVIPFIAGAAVAQTNSGKRMPFALRIDTVHLEPDGMRAEIVWRGALMVSPEDVVGMRIAGTVHQAGASSDIPDLSAFGTNARPATPGNAPLTSTMVLPPELPKEMVSAPKAVAHPPSPGNAFGGTQILEVGPPPAKAPAPPPAPPKPTEKYAGTMIIEDDPPAPGIGRKTAVELALDKAPVSLPFAKNVLGGERADKKPAAASPATPWSDVRGNVPLPQVGQKETLQVGGSAGDSADLEERIQRALRDRAEQAAQASDAKLANAKPDPPIPSTEPTEPKRPVAKEEVKWRVEPTQASPAAKPVAPVQPRQDLKGRLYKKK